MSDIQEYRMCAWILFVGFLCLKLSGSIDWSWWIVFAPMYVGSIAVVVGKLMSYAAEV